MAAIKTKPYLAHLKPHVAEGLARLAKDRNVSQNSIVNEVLDAYMRQLEREALKEQYARDVEMLREETARISAELSHLDGEGLPDEAW